MKRLMKKLLSITAAVVLTALLVLTGLPSAMGADAASIAAQINAVSGLSAVAEASTVTVSGSSTNMANLTLNIDSGVTVEWNANVTGRATANNYVLTLTGGGTFNVADGGTVANAATSAGGTIYINGGITLNVNSGGLIDSPTTGSGSAVTIAGNVTDAVININTDGLIRSVPGGYAINDGSGFTQSSNNTQININGGKVEAGTAGAIRSTGSASVVTVNADSVVTSEPSSNVSPVISMNCDPPPTIPIYNVIINGGTVQTTNAGTGSFVIQTSQSVQINDGLVKSIAGRGINLVGENSVATVTGGTVTTETGTAVSTATTTLEKITNARVEVTGGTVEATGTGTAINITGYNSRVTVSDGFVLAKQGIAIDASGRPGNTSLGAESSTPVTVNGGLVYAWGSSLSGAVSPIGKLNTPVSGYVITWNTANGANKTYYRHETDDLSFLPATDVFWDNDTLGGSDGVRYGSSLFNREGFIDVTVIPDAYKLTVVNGTATGAGVTEIDDGVYMVIHETAVTITARPDYVPGFTIPPAPGPGVQGTMFKEWDSPVSSGTISDFTKAAPPERSATFTMPLAEVSVTAQFDPLYHLQVYNAEINNFTSYPYKTGGTSPYGYFKAGDELEMTAPDLIDGPDGDVSFTAWNYGDTDLITVGGSQTTTQRENVTFTMPERSSAVGVWPSGNGYTPPAPNTTTIVGGRITTTSAGATVSPDTFYTGYMGTGLFIEADVPTGKNFVGWIVYDAASGGADVTNTRWFTYTSPTDEKIQFITQDMDLWVVAVFADKTHTLTVNGGTGGGVFIEHATSNVTANTPSEGMRFAGWTIDSGGGDFNDTSLVSATFTMPDSDAVITAHFEPVISDAPDSPTPPPTDNGGTPAPTDNGGGRSPSATPKTGVRTYVLLTSVIAALSLTGIIVLVFTGKSKK